MYSLAIRKRIDLTDHFWKHCDYHFAECKIDCEGRYWLADPFVFEKNGVVYLFYEAYDLVLRRGLIGYSIYEDNNTPAKINIIINETYHLSFPYIFEFNDDIYIMPETSGDYSLYVYKALSFPNVWEKVSYVLSDVYACDSIFIRGLDGDYLLTSEMYHNVPDGKYASCWVKNYIYNVKDLTVQDSEGMKVAEGEFGIRNAGAVFSENGKMFRIGQDCRYSQYGRGLVLFEIKSLSPYIEKKIELWEMSDFDSHITRSDATALVGVHTYNISNNYEIIDFSQTKRVCPKTLRQRRFYRLCSIVCRIIRKMKFLP